MPKIENPTALDTKADAINVSKSRKQPNGLKNHNINVEMAEQLDFLRNPKVGHNCVVSVTNNRRQTTSASLHSLSLGTIPSI
jgi:hypothetical protein